jgi:hypothetical protein
MGEELIQSGKEDHLGSEVLISYMIAAVPGKELSSVLKLCLGTENDQEICIVALKK